MGPIVHARCVSILSRLWQCFTFGLLGFMLLYATLITMNLISLKEIELKLFWEIPCYIYCPFFCHLCQLVVTVW